MEAGKFVKTVSASIIGDQHLLRDARDFLNGRSSTFVITAEGRTFQVISIPTKHRSNAFLAPNPHAPSNKLLSKPHASEHMSAEDVLTRIMSRWKNHEALFEISDGIKNQLLGTKNAIESHKLSKADSSQHTYVEVSEDEIDALVKDALDSAKVIKLDRESVPDESATALIHNHQAPIKEVKCPVTTQATRADLIFARMVGRVISRIIQAKEQEARKADTQRREETQKKEKKAEELQQEAIKKEIHKHELRKEIRKNESSKS